MSHRLRRTTLEAEFARQFGAAPPEIWCRAPGRVDLMGSHTDYNECFVLTCTIDRDTWLVARRRDDRTVNLYSRNLQDAASFGWGAQRDGTHPKWADYVHGVGLLMEREGFVLAGCDVLIDGNIPLGCGLSSSASLEIAAAILFSRLGGFEMDRVALAKLCQRAENEIVGVSCGILDQYTSVFGARHSVLLLDCRTLTSVKADFPRDIGLVLCNTGVPRDLGNSQFGQRRQECEVGAALLRGVYPAVRTLRDVTAEQLAAGRGRLSTTVAKRCQFIIEENDRVAQLMDALARNDRDAIGRITAASYAGARDLFEMTIPAMHAMMDAMLGAPGVIGARQSGGGFGGCMSAFVDARNVDEFIAHVDEHYARAAGVKPEIHSLHTADGAGLVAHTADKIGIR